MGIKARAERRRKRIAELEARLAEAEAEVIAASKARDAKRLGAARATEKKIRKELEEL